MTSPSVCMAFLLCAMEVQRHDNVIIYVRTMLICSLTYVVKLYAHAFVSFYAGVYRTLLSRRVECPIFHLLIVFHHHHFQASRSFYYEGFFLCASIFLTSSFFLLHKGTQYLRNNLSSTCIGCLTVIVFFDWLCSRPFALFFQHFIL